MVFAPASLILTNCFLHLSEALYRLVQVWRFHLVFKFLTLLKQTRIYFICTIFLSFSSPFSIAEDFSGRYENINNDSIVGRLWLPDSPNQEPAILLIGGSGGGYENQDAEWLSSSGFVVLNVGYFGAKGLPKNLVNVPIEYFNRALDWLNNHPLVKKDDIGIFAHSRGTEVALLTSYYNSLVKAIVVRSPSAVVWLGPGWSGFNESAWSWKSKPIPFLNVGLIDGAIWLSHVLRDKKLIKSREMFENALTNNSSINEARLPVEHIKGHLLLISGSDDQQWPSTAMSDMLVSILTKSDFEFSYRHIAFKNAGHRPGRLSTPDDTFANGGTIEGNIEAHKQTKILVKEFFDEKLR